MSLKRRVEALGGANEGFIRYDEWVNAEATGDPEVVAEFWRRFERQSPKARAEWDRFFAQCLSE